MHSPNRQTLWLVLLIFTFSMAAAETALAQKVYTDTEFDEKDWNTFGPYITEKDAENATFSAQQLQKSGDNYMEVTLTRATVNSGEIGTWGAVINNTMVWDPAQNAQGPVGKVDLLFDLDGGGAWSLAVRQGEFVWMAVTKRIIRTSSDFIVISINSLDEEDFIALPGSEFEFVNQPLHPDFSADGAPISFGVGVGLSCPSSSICTATRPVTFDLDNLEVTVWPYVPLNAGHNGNWWAGLPRSGEGVQLEVADGGEESLILVATVYSYNPMGKQIFMIAVGSVKEDESEVDVFITEGGLWGADFDPALVMETQWGTGTIRSCGCDNLVMDLKPNAEYKAKGYTDLLHYELVRLTVPAIHCPISP